MSESKQRTLLVLPAYNEEESIAAVLDDLRGGGYADMLDVLVLNDGSSDATAAIVRERGFDVLSQVFNMGYGAALQTAYKYAVDCEYDYLIQIDADGQHDLKNIDLIFEKLIEQPGGEAPADVVIGSRFLEGAQSFPLSPAKKPVIALFRWIIRTTTGKRLTDPTSGLWGLNKKAFSYFAIRNNFDTKYPDLNMILQMLLEGFNVQEFPAIMHERKAGASMHSGLSSALYYAAIMSLSTFGVLIRSHEKKAQKS